jgi:hypothetical protein
VKQLRAEQKHWEKRLIELADEERAEPARLRETYDVKMTRFEPIGIVYLWPVTA